MKIETIEKAAKEYAKDKYGGKNAKEWAIAQIHAGRDGFIEGAQWRISSVWHGMDHVANPDLLLLVRLEEDEYELAFWPKLDGSGDFPTFTFDRWKEWAYVKNLLPERKEEKK